MSDHIDQIVGSIPSVIPADRRYVIAIAGPPAAGKSTLARGVQARLGNTSAVLGLDAYHYDNAVLQARGMLERKGSIATFDPDAYRRDLTALRDRPDLTIAIPVFDRDLELSRNCAALVTPTQQIVITEGNYLLINHEPWAALNELFDLTVWIETPPEALRKRLMTRWASHGYDQHESIRRIEHNDLPNATYVIANSAAADHTITSL